MALLLRRGLLAGLVAGLVSGVYLLFVGEPVIDQAIRLEAAASGGAGAVELLSRGTQKFGLVGATTLYGVAVGGVFALAYQLLEPRMAAGTVWDKAVRLAAPASARCSWCRSSTTRPTRPGSATPAPPPPGRGCTWP